MPKSHLIIIALKTTHTSILKHVLPHIMMEESIVLTLQNGLGCDDEIFNYTGSENILGGLCFLCSNKVGPGHIRHLDYGLITMGEYKSSGQPGGITKRLQEVGSLFQSSNVPVQLIDDLSHARWKKLVWNIPFNGLSVIRNQLTDQLVADTETRNLCLTLMQEVAAASAACSRPIEQSFIDKMMSNTRRMKPYAPSMKLDFERGNRMELESIYGNPIRAARASGVTMPETEKLYQQLKALQPD